jgi:hypothetical protein
MGESTNEWVEIFTHASIGTRDIVEILAKARTIDPRIGMLNVRASLCARKAFGLSMSQAHFIAGWLVGEVSDEMLRREVPIVF